MGLKRAMGDVPRIFNTLIPRPMLSNYGYLELRCRWRGEKGESGLKTCDAGAEDKDVFVFGVCHLLTFDL